MAGTREQRKGFGPNGSWTAGVHNVFDHLAKSQPSAPALADEIGTWTYLELQTASLQMAEWLQQKLHTGAQPAPDWGSRPRAPRPLAIFAERSREFFGLCLAAWRLGFPVVALSRDMPDKAAELQRNAQILADLKPIALIHGLLSINGSASSKHITDMAEVEALVGLAKTLTAENGSGPAGMPLLSLVEALSVLGTRASASADLQSPVSPQSVLAYVYTGGTTKASKCVAVTHGMMMWEAENYATALCGMGSPADRFLQYSSLYWGAAVFGQLSLGLACGGCVCIGGSPRVRGGDALQQLVRDVQNFQVTLLGIVPSQLRGAWPGGPASAPKCVRKLVLWADKCPPALSKQWQEGGFRTIDLLIASEYWLALYSDCRAHADGNVEKHIYRPLPTMDVRFLLEDPETKELRDAAVGEVGEMYLAGPTTSPGYVCPDGHIGLDHHDAERVVDGRVYLRTRDTLKLLPGGGLIYAGRADSMMKHGGAWVDSDALQEKVAAVPGVSQAAVLPGPNGIDAFVVLHSSVLEGGAGPEGDAAGSSPAKRPCLRGQDAAPFRVLAAVRRVLPAGTTGGCRVHLCTSLPLHKATGKVDRRALTSRIEALTQIRQEHDQQQTELEQAAAAGLKSWTRLAVGSVSMSQLVYSVLFGLVDVASLGSFSAKAQALNLLQLGLGCAAKLIVLPELWATLRYMEETRGRRGDKQKWKPIVEFFQKAPVLGEKPLAAWLPLLLAMLLPGPCSGLTVAAASAAFLAFERERDVRLACGFASLAGAAMSGGLLDSASWLTRLGASWAAAAVGPARRASLTMALLGAGMALSSPQLKEFLHYICLSVPGLCFAALPKVLLDQFGHKMKDQLVNKSESSPGPTRLGALLKHLGVSQVTWPKWSGKLIFDEEKAVVDQGNTWAMVSLEPARGGSVWDSVGVKVKVGEDLLEALERFPKLQKLLSEEQKPRPGASEAVRCVKVWSGWMVDSVVFVFQSGAEHGKRVKGGHEGVLQLTPGEYITEVRGFSDGPQHHHLLSLTFVTSRGREATYGLDKGARLADEVAEKFGGKGAEVSPFSFTADEGHQITGLVHYKTTFDADELPQLEPFCPSIESILQQPIQAKQQARMERAGFHANKTFFDGMEERAQLRPRASSLPASRSPFSEEDAANDEMASPLPPFVWTMTVDLEEHHIEEKAEAATAAVAPVAVPAAAVAPVTGPLAPLATLVGRIAGRSAADGLHGMDSLQAITLAEAIRREFGKEVSVAAVLGSAELADLAELVESSSPVQAGGKKEQKDGSLLGASERWLRSERFRRIWLCGMGPGTCTVDWMVSRKGAKHHMDPAALQRAVDKLVARHATLRTQNCSELPMFDPTYNAASLWQLLCQADPTWTHSMAGQLIASSIFGAWPRTEVQQPGSPLAQVRVLVPTLGQVLHSYPQFRNDGTGWSPSSDDEHAFWIGSDLLKKAEEGLGKEEPRPLFTICTIPILRDSYGGSMEECAAAVARRLAPEEVTWYVYAVLDHGYCDGPAGLPLYADLLRLYAEEANEVPPTESEMDPDKALQTLQKRLMRSLMPWPEAEHPNDDIFHDGLVGIGWRRGYQRHIQFQGAIARALRYGAQEQLGCSVDVAWLTAISAAFFRMFPEMKRVDLYLVVTCRDSPGEEALVGYFSSRKLLTVELGDPSTVPLLGLADIISAARRGRTWRRPRPFEKAGAIEVNIVSQAVDGLPHGFQEVRCPRSGPSDWNRNGNCQMNLRLDQCALDSWDFRLQSHDASWDWKWSTFYAQALGSSILDVAIDPTRPVVPRE